MPKVGDRVVALVTMNPLTNQVSYDASGPVREYCVMQILAMQERE